MLKIMKKISLILSVIVLVCIVITGCAEVKYQSIDDLIGNGPILKTTTPSTAAASTVSSETKSTNIEYYFSQQNQKPDQQLIKLINSAKNTLEVSIYSLTKKDIVNAIIAAKGRGVKVRLVSDKQESGSKSQSQELNLIKKSGIPVKINSHKGLMHEKISIIDKSIVTTGSFNYSQAATSDNDEVLVVIHSSTIAQDWEKEFERMWNDTKNYSDY